MKKDRSGSEAAEFRAVIRQWQEGIRPTEPLNNPPFVRLSGALDDSNASHMDRWVLLRHVLRYETLRTGRQVHVTLPASPESRAAELGLVIHPQAGGRSEISALPWTPSWLEGGARAVDETAMRDAQVRDYSARGPPADPLLRALRLDSYRSVAQQCAIQAALSMPAGAFLIVDLPTGEGKSTVFRVIESAGFSSSPAGRVPGLVVVVVPTVTLALDHEQTSGGTDDRPLAYVGGRDSRNRTIHEAIRLGTQRLLFAAPEAVVQSLRTPISKAAQDGALGAVVIDEAHLIDAWGTGFRTQFQTLAGVLNAWRASAPPNDIHRTIFLSATFSDAALQTLQDLFSPVTPIPIVSGARIRPEPEYWVSATADNATRSQRVYEAICHLPRPAILYVTRVADAEWWWAKLRSRGFSRIALVHGGTSAETREDVLTKWHDGTIDVVVATSAFGLGIDYPHVRTVVHACLPESLDRFYQEVGRGGRDGRASISLLIPQNDDAEIARSLNLKKVITIERGLQRWRAMFQHPASVCEGYPQFVIPLDVPPGHDIEDIDLVGERSTDWNQRTLALMARSGLIRLLGACTRESNLEAGPNQFERIEIVDEGHLGLTAWQARVEPTRLRIAEQDRRAFGLLTRFATGRECPTRLIGSLYSGEGRHVALVCSGCRVCRDDPASKVAEGTVPYRRSPWPLQGTLAPILDLVWRVPRFALVSYPLKAPVKRTVREFLEAVRRLDSYGLRIWLDVGEVPTWMRDSVAEALYGKPWVVQMTDSWSPVVWPSGARIIACAPARTPTAMAISTAAKRAPHIVFIGDGSPDPTQPNRQLAEIIAGPVYSLDKFLAVILQ